MCSYPKIIYITPSYLSVLKLQSFYSQCSSCVFFRKIEEKLFWAIKAINEASVTNSTMNVSHSFDVIADAKALCSILYSFGNIQINSCWCPVDPSPTVTLSWQKTSASRALSVFTSFCNIQKEKQVLQ